MVVLLTSAKQRVCRSLLADALWLCAAAVLDLHGNTATVATSIETALRFSAAADDADRDDSTTE